MHWFYVSTDKSRDHNQRTHKVTGYTGGPGSHMWETKQNFLRLYSVLTLLRTSLVLIFMVQLNPN